MTELPKGMRYWPEGSNQIQVRYYGSDGKRYAKSFRRKTDAIKFQRGIESSKDRREWIDPSAERTRFEDFAEDWLGTKIDTRARTLINIEGRMRKYILPEFGGRRMSSIRPSEVQKWVATMSAQGLAPSTVKAIYRTFSQVMSTAEIDGKVKRTPCVGIKLPKETKPQKQMHILTPKQVADLGGAVPDRYRCLIYTAAYTGMRAGELAALKVDRVKLLERRIQVIESASEVRGKLMVGPTKTGKARDVSLPSFLADMIGQHIGRFPSEEGFVFTSPQGRPIRHRNFYQRVFQPALERAGLPHDLRFHDLRHSCAAILIEQGWHPKQIQERLGHASIRTTLDRYGRLFTNHDTLLLEGLDQTIRGASL